ncbi:tetratricopeptide repeat protein [Leptospira sp. GIMC2001]|uniref:tetratricopeptide repeat protein n=1 Tax=Leptospira sp. GIMC2001 TaxID=1513297 RepID=UPI0023498456|nr:hypothetical protein [Leptospira sp. GIMC2001]WCL49882.1 hypothetical protein O4O04_03430 [Leptospira sp. GIMC2001]
MAKRNWDKKQNQNTVDFEDVEKWKVTLALNEAELKALDKSIRNMVNRTSQAGALSWKIAQAYMKASNYEMGLRYYQRAIDESDSASESASSFKSTGEVETNSGTRMAYWESSLPYFNKSLVYKKIDKELLFQAGLAYANASRNMGWEPERRSRAIDLFTSLSQLDPLDSRFPYQLALIYFDSSVSSGSWAIQESYNQEGLAFSLLNEILKKEPENVPVRFARANFLYRIGKTSDAYNEYRTIRSTIEAIDARGEIRGGLEKNSSYINVLKNLEQLESGKR